MSSTVDFSEVYKALGNLDKKVNSSVNASLKKASEYGEEVLKSNTPKWTGSKSKGKRGTYMLKHAENSIVSSGVKNGQLEIGYAADVAWRMHFIEFGTIKQAPQAIVEKTTNQIDKKVTEIIKEELSGRLEL